MQCERRSRRRRRRGRGLGLRWRRRLSPRCYRIVEHDTSYPVIHRLGKVSEKQRRQHQHCVSWQTTYRCFNRSSNATARSRSPLPSSARNMASHVDGYTRDQQNTTPTHVCTHLSIRYRIRGHRRRSARRLVWDVVAGCSHAARGISQALKDGASLFNGTVRRVTLDQ